MFCDPVIFILSFISVGCRWPENSILPLFGASLPLIIIHPKVYSRKVFFDWIFEETLWKAVLLSCFRMLHWIAYSFLIRTYSDGREHTRDGLYEGTDQKFSSRHLHLVRNPRLHWKYFRSHLAWGCIRVQQEDLDSLFQRHMDSPFIVTRSPERQQKMDGWKFKTFMSSFMQTICCTYSICLFPCFPSFLMYSLL